MRGRILIKASFALFLFCLINIPARGQNLLSAPETVVYDAAHDRYLAVNMNGGNIIRIDKEGRQAVFASGLQSAHGLAIVGDTVFAGSDGGALVGINGFDLNTGQWLMNIRPEGGPIAGQQYINGLAADSSGNIYAAGTGHSYIWKISLGDLSIQRISNSISRPNALHFDRHNNRLLVASDVWWTPLYAINLADLEVTAATTATGQYSGIAEDSCHNYYVAFFAQGTVFKFDSTLSGTPVAYAQGLSGPEGICFNQHDNLLIVPNLSSSTISYLEAFVSAGADVTYGWPPLAVNFWGQAEMPVTDWNWNFSDGGSAVGQYVSHTFEEPGGYNISHDVTYDAGHFIRNKEHYISILADSLKGPIVSAGRNQIVEITISAANTVSLRALRIPIEYGGSLPLEFSSYSVEGCRTSGFNDVSPTTFSPGEHKLGFLISNSSGQVNILEPGSGPVFKIYFSVPDSARPGQSAPIILDGFSGDMPTFFGLNFTFEPRVLAGEVSIPYTCGDADGNGPVNIKDITFYINFLYRSGPSPVPIAAVDVNGDGQRNIKDITYLINFLYRGGPALKCL